MKIPGTVDYISYVGSGLSYVFSLAVQGVLTDTAHQDGVLMTYGHSDGRKQRTVVSKYLDGLSYSTVFHLQPESLHLE